jgi:hypothetical protein
VDELFLGYDWLIKHNPTIDWKKKTIDFNHCGPNCGNLQDNPDYIQGYIRAFATKSTDLAIKEAAKKPKQTLEELIPPSLLEYRELFEPTAFDELPQHWKWDHTIDFKPDANIHDWKVKTYPLSVHEQDTLDEFLKENLRTGRIRPSKSPIPAPFFIKKKDGSLRPIQDYRRLNDITVKNRYPLPLISEVIDKVKDYSYYSKLDIQWGYNNVRIKAGDEWKAAFKTNRGTFEPLVMFFRLTNSLATFQTMMNEIFFNKISEGWFLVYMDDLLIMAHSEQENLE